MKLFYRSVSFTLLVQAAVSFVIAQPSANAQDQNIRDKYPLVLCNKGGNPAICTTEDFQQDLITAITHGDKDDVPPILAKLKNVNFVDIRTYRTPLSLATQQGKHEIVAALLRKGANPLMVDQHKRPFLYTDIIAAYSSGSELRPEVVECVRMILEKAARLGQLPTEPSIDASVVFFPGAKKPSLELLQLFLKYGAEPTRKGWYSYDGNSPLDVAIAKNNLEAVRIMVQLGNRISQIDLDERAFYALKKQQGELLAILRFAGADPKRHLNANPKILFDAASPEGSVEILEFLLKNGADPNSLKHEKLRSTPIFSTGLDPEKIRLLLKYGADPNFRDNGYTLLANVLFHHGKEISVRPLSMSEKSARVYSKVSLVNLLLDHGADLNANNGGWGQWGALGLTRREDKEVIDLLVKRGATLSPERGGYTLLPQLREKYGNATQADKAPGPITIAVDILERDDLALALLARDGKIGPKDRLALLQATRRGWHDVAQALLLAGANPNAADEKGLTPLAMAQRRRDKTLINMLAAAGATMSTQTVKPSYKIEGWNEFDIAVANEIDEVAFFDPPRFTLSLYFPKTEPSFALYGRGVNQFEEIKCERSVVFTIIANAGIAGGISIGVCSRESQRLQKLASEAKQGVELLFNQLAKGGMKLDEVEFKKLGWTYEKKVGPNRTAIHYFPLIGIGHGILSTPTVLLVSEKADQVIIVQADVTNLCGEGRSMQNQTVLCSDTKNAIIDIAQRLFGRFQPQYISRNTNGQSFFNLAKRHA